MNKYLLAAAFMLCSIVSLNVNGQQFRTCGTDQMVNQALQQDPGYAAIRAKLEQQTQEFVQQMGAQKSASGPILYTIPVVVHVIHNYGAENISKAQILDGIDILNKSFQKFYADSLIVCSVFQPIIADVQVQFKLAQLDPNGNCTDGITRTVSEFTYDANDNVKGLIAWPSNKYFNIWSVQNIASGAAGYAYFPGIAASIDGVVMRSEYIGSIGTSSGSNYDTRSLTHEAGHWLNLSHTWGGTNNPGLPQNCSDDDFVADTPNTIGVDNFSCDTTQVTCSSLDNVQNYMDYAGCHYMFTNGQKARMHAALNNNAGQRNNLHTQSNLIATGTDDNFSPVACTPIAEFQGNIRYICAGTTITFTDLSWRGDASNWQWDFPGGTPSTSNDQNPSIQYNTPGVYDVTLTASNAAGSNTLTQNGVVVVSPATGVGSIPFTEDFENTGPIPSSYDWIIDNENGNAWQLSTVAAFSGTHAMRLVNHSGNPNGTTDIFVTPGYDFSNIAGASMTFKLAFAARSSSSTDQLRVFASNNCGQQWNIRYTKSGLNLSTAGILSASFTPNGTSQWREENVNVTGVAYNNKPSVRFKFEYTQHTGNNIYIDDINITGTSTIGIEDVEFLATVNVFPNPSAGNATVGFSLSEPALMMIELTDLAGRVVDVIENNRLSAGQHQYTFGDHVSGGAYFIRFTANDNQMTRKVLFTR